MFKTGMPNEIYPSEENFACNTKHALYQRDARGIILPCKFYDKVLETYHVGFERYKLFNPIYDELKITYNNNIFVRIFDGRTEFAECFPVDYVGSAIGCN
uniref:Uncharacterized protein n=1 Tax=Romanomermis culicivorax TaxID=13658 RepID=A0A915HMQ7_ROMCU